MVKTFRKKLTSIMLCLCLVLSGVGILNFGKISLNFKKASATENQSTTDNLMFYYQQLDAGEKKFYDALDDMKSTGVFKTSGAYDLLENNVVTNDQLFEYSDGNPILLKQFSNAKDAFYLDNPELFYVNFDVLSLSFGKKGDEYTAVIDSGRTASSYLVEGFTSENVQEAIDFFDGDDGVKKYLPTEEDLSDYEKIEYVVSIMKAVKCEFIAGEFGKNLNNAYGVVKNGYGTSTGIAKTFNVCMNKLGIPCVQVFGYKALEGELNFNATSWNYVQINEKWYAVDVSSNAKQNNLNNICFGLNLLSKNYIEAKSVSTNGKEFSYPTIAQKNYNQEKLLVEIVKSEMSSVANCSYNGKSATELVEDGLYLVIMKVNIVNFNFYYSQAEALFAQESDATKYSTFDLTGKCPMIVVGVTDIAPNSGNRYTSLKVSDLLISETVIDDNYGKIESYSNPKIVTAVAKNTTTEEEINLSTETVLDSRFSWIITLTYDVDLKKVVNEDPVGVKLLMNNDLLNKPAFMSDVVWTSDNAKQISFKINPNKAYQYGGDLIWIQPTNLIKANENRLLYPTFLKLSFEKKSVTISQNLGNGRLYLEKFKTPALLDDFDINLVGDSWTSLNDTQFMDLQSDQLIMISSKPSDYANNLMVDAIIENLKIQETDVLKTNSYNLSISICGEVPVVPQGKNLNIAFPYPEGYSHESKNVEFLIYLFKGASSLSPVKLDACASEYGLVAETSSFGRFVVMAVKSQENTSKLIYARVINDGGEIQLVSSVDAAKSVSRVSGEEVKYFIETNAGYKIDYVILNGKNITDNVDEGFVTINAEDLVLNNEISVAFVSETVANEETENEITNLNASLAENYQFNYVRKLDKQSEKGGLKTWVIVVIVICSVVFAATATTVTIVIIKKKALKK